MLSTNSKTFWGYNQFIWGFIKLLLDVIHYLDWFKLTQRNLRFEKMLIPALKFRNQCYFRKLTL